MSEQQFTPSQLPEMPAIPGTTFLDAAVTRRRFLSGLVGVGAVLASPGLAACTFEDTEGAETKAPESSELPGLAEMDTSKEVDLLKAGTWDFMPGAEKVGGALRISRTGLAVLKLNEGDAGRPPKSPQYEANPPVNLFGAHLEMKDSGGVGIRARLSDVKGGATLSFLASPTVRFDERLERQSGLDIRVDGSKAVVSLWNGTGPAPISSEEYDLGENASNYEITVAQTDEGLRVGINNTGVRIPAGAFENQIWFGLDSDGSFTLEELTAYPANGNELSMVDTTKTLLELKPSGNGLKDVAKAHGRGDKAIGTAIDLVELVANPEYAQFVVDNFNQLEPSMLAKFQALQPEQGKFEFAELDALVQFANAHGMRVHGHALAFTEAYPQWLHDKLNDPATTAEDARKILVNHVETAVGRYNGKQGRGLIDSWDVGNELFDPENWGELNKESIWYKKIGPDYIQLALETARRMHPDLKMYINDWGAETDDDRFDAERGLAAQLKAAGVEINLGFQAHIDEETLADEDAINDLRSGMLDDKFAVLAEQGVGVRIAEASVAGGDTNPELQAEVYEILVGAIMRAPNAAGFNLWGAANSEKIFSYYTGSGYNEDPGNDAPVVQGKDGKIQGRPAWAAIERAIAA